MQSRMLVRSVGLYWTLIVCVALLLPPLTTFARAATGAAFLVKDIATTTVPGDVALRQKLGVINNLLLFRGVDLLHGEEVWRTDGTPAGTSLVKDVAPGPHGSLASSFQGRACGTPSAVVNGTLFFIANQGPAAFELWKTDGTDGGTVRITSIKTSGEYIDEENGSCSGMWVVNGVLLFSGGSYYESRLWRSDGTPAGTVSLDAYVAEGLVVNNTLFFLGFRSGLWRSDGTHAGTRKIKDVSYPGELTSVGSTLFFLSYSKLWKSDGTSSGTISLKDFFGTGSMLPLNGGVLFIATDSDNNTGLWKSNGTTAGTVLVKKIAPRISEGYPNPFVTVGGTVFFAADDGSHGIQLWKSDGTAAGTVVVKDIVPNEGMVAVGGTLFFSVNGAQQGLWKSDGTASGTQRLLNRSSVQLTAAAGRLFFTVGTTSDHRELWSSDGTVAGTVYLKDVVGDGQDDLPAVIDQNGIAFFSGLNAQGVQVVWRSDGTLVGTTPLTDGASRVGGSFPTNLTAVGNTLFFVVSLIPTCLPPRESQAAENCAAPGQELWRSDGTDAGTTRIKRLPMITDLVSAQGKLFFSGTDQSGPGLWQSDGTNAGTVQVAPMVGPLASLTNVNGAVFFKVFFGDDDYPEYYLWRSDGTRAGTVKVQGPDSDGFVLDQYAPLVSVNGKLFFMAMAAYSSGTSLWKADATTVTGVSLRKEAPFFLPQLRSVQGQLYFADEKGALWTSDGTTAGTRRIKSINGSYRTVPSELQSSGGKLLFQANDSAGSELWRSNGQSSGTTRVKDIRPGLPSSNPSELVSVNGTLFFRANDGKTGTELWKSNATANGTVLVKDIAPGSAASYPTGLTRINNALLFTAGNPTSGRELWISNGTAAGTTQVQDIAPGAASSDPAGFTVVGSRIFFSADDGVHGNELWSIPLASLGLATTDSVSSDQ